MVTAKPKAKLTINISGKFFVAVSEVPILLPMGVIDISAPREKRPMPRTRNNVPRRKLSIRSVGMGAIVSESTRTTATIGITLFAASDSFSLIIMYLFLIRRSVIRSPL